MGLFLVSFVVMILVVAAMSVGVIVSNRRIKGSCGQLAAMGIERACGCPDPCERRRREMARSGQGDGEQVIRFR